MRRLVVRVDEKTLDALRAISDTNTPEAFRADLVIAKLVSGTSDDAIAERFGGNAATVSKWVVRFNQYGIDGLRQRRPGPPNRYFESDRERVLAYRDSGMSFAAIAREVGCSSSFVLRTFGRRV